MRSQNADERSRALRRAHAPARVLFCALVMVCATVPAAAANQPLSTISEAAQQFADTHGLHTGERRTIEVAPLDARLRLDACPVPLATSAAPGVRSNLRMTVEVRCPVEGSWRLFVPVRIKAYDKAVVALRALPRGHVLSQADLSVIDSDVSSLPPGYARDAAALIGRRTSRPLTAGAVLGGSVMVLEPTVRRGQAVTLLAQGRGVSIRAQGVAVTAAGVDERIRIKNLSSGREVEGIVRSAAVVEIPLP